MLLLLLLVVDNEAVAVDRESQFANRMRNGGNNGSVSAAPLEGYQDGGTGDSSQQQQPED